MKRFKQSKGFPAGFNPQQLSACRQLLADLPCPAQLHWNEREVFACFDGWWLTSEFFPVASFCDTAPQRAHYAARLRIHGRFGQSLPADWLFALNYGESKTVSLLKLIRVLHLLNHLGRNDVALPLRIDLDPRICHAFSDRIIDFTTALLAELGLASRQVMFLLFINQPTVELGVALVRRYREQGHLLGLGGFGDSGHDLSRLWRLEPDFVCLSPRRDVSAGARPAAGADAAAGAAGLCAGGGGNCVRQHAGHGAADAGALLRWAAGVAAAGAGLTGR